MTHHPDTRVILVTGTSSREGLTAQLQAALADSSVNHIVLDIESVGLLNVDQALSPGPLQTYELQVAEPPPAPHDYLAHDPTKNTKRRRRRDARKLKVIRR